MKNGPYELLIPPVDYPGKRYRGRYAYEHRVNWWKSTGKNPDDFPDQLVHHGDQDKRNNVPENLDMMERSKHTAHHAPERKSHDKICLNCKKPFSTFKYDQKFCCRICIGLYNYPGQAKYSK